MLVEVPNSMLYINFSWWYMFMKNSLNGFTDICGQKYDIIIWSSLWCIASSIFRKHFIIQTFATDREITAEYSYTLTLSLARILMHACTKCYKSINT